MIECKICKYECIDIKKLSIHIKNAHKISSKEYYDKYFKTEDNVCIVCGNKTKFINLSKGYNECCSRKCSNISPNRIEKINKTKKDRFGDDLSIIYEKAKNTVRGWSKERRLKYSKNLSNGIKNAIKNNHDEIVENRIKTTKERYGDNYFVELGKSIYKNKTKYDFEVINKKRRMTCREKYGVDSVMYLNDVVEKVKQSLTPEIRQKATQRGLETKINNGTILSFDNPLRNRKRTYKNKVHHISHINAKENFTQDELSKLGLCGMENGLQIDHLFSVEDCYNNDVPVEMAAHPANLRIIPWQENLKKWHRSDISVNNLYEKINNW